MEAAVTAAETFTAIVTTVAVVAATSIVTSAVIAATTVVAAAIVATVEPRAGADEDAADEVVRAVVAVRSAGVRIVAVVTVGAGRRRANGAIDRTHSDAKGNLGVGAACGKKQNSQKRNIF
jgi:hypothetical protein